jgi:S-adenosylmethionine:tRNA ribosyltransferase-isomerase
VSPALALLAPREVTEDPDEQSTPSLQPARTYPERRDQVRLLAVDPRRGTVLATHMDQLPSLLAPGDLLVMNDAATLPASLQGHDQERRPLEARLCGQLEEDHFQAVLFGAGDWHLRTEDRPPPPPVAPGARLFFGPLAATVLSVSPLSPRLVVLRFDQDGDQLWRALYRHGRPVQYAHLAHPLPLWAVQNVYAARPVAFEMPSAGRPLSWRILLQARARGVKLCTVSHAAGLSATGDPALDAALPLPERFEIPAATAAAVKQTRARGGRVVAVGTTVVRALEGAHRLWGSLRAGSGVTDLRLDGRYRPQVASGLLSGMHEPRESHFALLGAFADQRLLRRAHQLAAQQGFHSHELGDAQLIL